MELNKILYNIPYTCDMPIEGVFIDDIVFDSRKAEKNTLFVCIKGFRSDGHDYAKEVYEAGVRVFAVEQNISLPDDAIIIKVENTRRFLATASANFFKSPAKELNTIGITGTKGKTSISFMLKSIYECAGHKVGVIGSTGIYIGSKFYDTANSTPESYFIHKYYREMLDEGCDTAIIEATSQGFKLDRTYGIQFNTAVFSNLSPDHISEFEHKDFDEYLNCKRTIFNQSDKAVVNADSDFFERIVQKAECPITTVSNGKNADYTFDNIHFSADKNGLKTGFRLYNHINGSSCDILLNTPGYFSLYNATMAIAVAHQDGISYEDIKAGLAKSFVKGRMEIVPVNKNYTVIIDFAHNEFSCKTLFETINLYKPSRIISVFGCGGNRSKLRRYSMGEVIGSNSDLSVITSDNSRFEKTEDIINDILVGMHKTDGKYIIIPERRKAIKEALREAREGDVVLLIGKGHEMYEEIEGVQHPFDERQVVYESLNELQQQDG